MSAPLKNIAVVCNPTIDNRRALKVGDEVANVLVQKNIKHQLFTNYWPQVLDNFTEVWIVGGDGTLNYFINKYKGIKLPFALFKGGSGNDFHWMMYGDLNTTDQVEKLLSAEPFLIDAGICNGILFLNGVGIGFDGAIVKDMLGKKKMAGKASYLLSILKNIVKYHEEFYSITIDGETIEKECLLVSIANGKRYGGGFNVAPLASVTDGVLDVNVVGKIAPFKRIKYLPVIEEGKHIDLPFVHYRQSNKIHIKANKNLPCHIDGEYFEAKEFEIECLPGFFLFLK
jgi:YegS/Rv2252/BmrU family lipid kinase